MHQPRETHWLATIRVLSYIKSCPEKGLMYRKHGHVHISRYSVQVIGSGYANDRRNRKSTTRYCTFVKGNLVTWRRKKQDVSRSSAKLSIELWLMRHAR